MATTAHGGVPEKGCSAGKEIREAFVPRPKPDAPEQYADRHDNTWPELPEDARAGRHPRKPRFQRDDSAVLAPRVCDDAPWDQPWDSDRYRPWGALAGPSMHECGDGIVDSRELAEIRHVVPGRAATKG